MEKVKPAELIIICFMLLQGFAAALNCSSPTPSSLFKELEKNVFSEKMVRPVQSFSAPLNITLSIIVVGILGVDEKTQTMSSVLWQVLEWDIDGLSWDEEQCGGKRVSVPREELWLPDIHISEFIEEDNSPQTPYVYLHNTGHVYDGKPVTVVSSCQLGIYTFPFDVQNCTLTFRSSLHVAEDIRMIQGYTAEEVLNLSRDMLQTNGEWELADISTAQTNTALEATYSEIKFFIVLRRRPIMYVVNLLIPSCFLITVDLFSFLLPPQSVDRSSFKMTLILGYTVFLLIMNDLLPVTGEMTPLINVFFSISLALMVASLLETIFITNVQFSSSQYSAVPRWLSTLVLKYLAFVVCLPRKKRTNRITICLKPPTKEPSINTSITNISGTQPQSASDDVKPLPSPLGPPPPPPPPPQDLAVDLLKKLSRDLAAIRLQMDKHFEGSKTSEEWQMIGIVIDRLLFSLYIIFILASFITIICIWIWNNSYAA